MTSYVRKDSGQRPDAKSIVARDGDVVLALFGRRQAQVTAGLARDLVAEHAQRAGEVVPREVSG